VRYLISSELPGYCALCMLELTNQLTSHLTAVEPYVGNCERRRMEQYSRNDHHKLTQSGQTETQ